VPDLCTIIIKLFRQHPHDREQRKCNLHIITCIKELLVIWHGRRAHFWFCPIVSLYVVHTFHFIKPQVTHAWIEAQMSPLRWVERQALQMHTHAFIQNFWNCNLLPEGLDVQKGQKANYSKTFSYSNRNVEVKYKSTSEKNSPVARKTSTFNREWIHFIRFEVFTAVTMKNGVFWDIISLYVLHRRHITSVTKLFRLRYVRFEVYTAVTMKNVVFLDVTPCGSCKKQRFGGI
jgi:hypothetical protein